MIAGWFDPRPGGAIPLIAGEVFVPSLNVRGDITFLIDTGTGTTVLAPAGANSLGIDVTALSSDRALRGVGGSVPALALPAILAFGSRSLELNLRILTPRSEAERAATLRLPNVLGRDVLSRFALFIEERTRRVLLLDPAEADEVHWP